MLSLYFAYRLFTRWVDNDRIPGAARALLSPLVALVALAYGAGVILFWGFVGILAVLGVVVACMVFFPIFQSLWGL